MNFYKKLIPSRSIRFKILKMMKFIPDKQMISLQYFIKLKRIPDLKNPKRYTEKIQWYKLNYRDTKMQKCVDKYLVREYVQEKGLGNILNKLYGVYDSIEEINFENLPDKFIIKTTNGSSTNYICKDKSTVNKEELTAKFANFFNQSGTSAGREWVYKECVPKIIVEELLEDSEKDDKSISDYKFLCFNGNPEYVVYDVDRFTNHRRNIYDTRWNNLHIASDCPCIDGECEKPEGLDEMLKVARVLSEDFPAVRVDLYYVGGKVYFGELTFFPWSGYVQYSPDKFDLEVGTKFHLPEKNI